ncbi:MAG: alanine racemase [Aquificae bacterium]|nr:alanine racemase [Aquificota bacterium]
MAQTPPRAFWEINLPAIARNVKTIKEHSKKDLIAVIKANAYGHGAIAVAKFLEPLEEIKFFAVSCVEEGIQLRQEGIKKPILLLSGFFEEELSEVKHFHLTPVVSDKKQLRLVLKNKIPYHLNIDTGMGRLGFLKPPYGLLKIFPPRGVMTHFPNADGDPIKTKHQIRVFKKLIRPLKVKFIHLQNTAGLVYSVPYANLVRVGLGLYGEKPTENLPLELFFPSTIKARILEVRKLPKGSCISYGCRYRLKKTSYVGVISFGYADGLDRKLFNSLRVFYRGKTYPVVGNITMDLTAVNFGKTKPNVGEYVEIINPRQKFSDLAKLLSSIPYEIMTRIGNRVKRTYRG